MIALIDPVAVETFRIQHEYLEMPGLRLTVAQAARLFGVSIADAGGALSALEQEGFLRTSVDPHGSVFYSRRI